MTDDITRRDFLDGIAIGAGALVIGCRSGEREAPFAPERDPSYYPPRRTGMRGNHPGSFEIAHQLRDGTLWQTIGEPEATGERYDLVIVGAGISGLAAAHLFRTAHADATVLLLDNHDDVGGHAKRNEIVVGGRTLVSYGGTESIEYPAQYSDVAKRVLAEIGIDIARFRTAFPRVDRGLATATFFDRETFGVDRLVIGDDDALSDAFLARAPITGAMRADLVRLRTAKDLMPGLASAAKKARLAKMSYRSFLLDVAKMSPATLPWFQTRTHSLYGVGIDAVPALDCWGLEFPGFAGLALDPHEPSPGLGRTPQLEMRDEPNVQFIDGNATVARLLVRRLIPAALPGSTMEDAVAARLDYAKLDDDASPIRIRLNSTAVRVRPHDDIEITYVRGGRAKLVHAGACVLACWNGVIPYLVPELPEAQRRALAYGVKVPLIYANVAIRSWRAFRELGVGAVSAPGGYFTSARVELHGDAKPEEPAIVKLVRTPCRPGLPARDQHRLGRHELLTTPFQTFERALRDELARILAGGGFDPARDIAGITVNRWSHGYAYEYNSLWDPAWPPGQEPCVLGRARFGRIAIANADAAAYAYTDAAIDQAWRAVTELVS